MSRAVAAAVKVKIAKSVVIAVSTAAGRELLGISQAGRMKAVLAELIHRKGSEP